MDKNEIKSVWAAFLEVQEGKKKKTEKLDPVGKEDDDVDNDGDTDSSDEYLKNRRKKVGQAMAKDKEQKEGKIPPQFMKGKDKKDDDSEDDESDEKDSKGKKPEKGENPFAKKKDDDKKKEVEESSKDKKDPKDPHGHKKAAKNPLNLNPNKTTKVKTYVREDEEECPKCEGKGCKHCDGKGYHESQQVDELSTKTLSSYINKASDARGHRGMPAKKVDKRYSGVATASKKLAKREGFELFSEAELAALEEKMKQPNDTGGKGEEFMSTNSAGEKKFYADHEKGSEKKYEDWEETSEKDASAAGKAVKSQSPVRRGESRKSEPMQKVKGQ